MIDWNHERHRTRDRLLEYDINIMPPRPHTAGLEMIYPWENTVLDILNMQILELARKNGFIGDEEDFWSRFINGKVHALSFTDFPMPGIEGDLYLDIDTDNLYYFKTISGMLTEEQIARVDAAIVDYSQIDDVTYLYIPIRALLIEDTILNCGNSEEVI